MGPARSAADAPEVLMALGGAPKSLLFHWFYCYLAIWCTKGGQGTPRAPQGVSRGSARHPHRAPRYSSGTPRDPQGTPGNPKRPHRDPQGPTKETPRDPKGTTKTYIWYIYVYLCLSVYICLYLSISVYNDVCISLYICDHWDRLSQ